MCDVECLNLFLKAINVCKRLELWENLCRCYTSQGSLYIRQQNTSAALTVIGEALKISERLDGKIACELLVLKAEVSTFLYFYCVLFDFELPLLLIAFEEDNSLSYFYLIL